MRGALPIALRDIAEDDVINVDDVEEAVAVPESDDADPTRSWFSDTLRIIDDVLGSTVPLAGSIAAFIAGGLAGSVSARLALSNGLSEMIVPRR